MRFRYKSILPQVYPSTLRPAFPNLFYTSRHSLEFYKSHRLTEYIFLKTDEL